MNIAVLNPTKPFENAGNRASIFPEVAYTRHQNRRVHPSCTVTTHVQKYTHLPVSKRLDFLTNNKPLNAIADETFEGADKEN